MWIVSDSVSKKLVIEKVSDSVSKKFGIRKSFGFSFVQIWVILGKVSVLKLLGFETFPFFIGFGFSIKKFGIGKKFRIRFRSDFGYRHTLHESRDAKSAN